jgi:hypothetical protein
MPLVTPDVQTPTGEPMSAPPSSHGGPLGTRCIRFDLIGVSVLAVTGAGLAGMLLLVRGPSAGPTTPPPLAAPAPIVDAPARSAPAMRDQWYLDAPIVPTVPRAGVPALAGKDRWYQDAPTTVVTPPRVPPVRDQWYVAAAQLPSLSTQARDQWYQEERTTP